MGAVDLTIPRSLPRRESFPANDGDTDSAGKHPADQARSISAFFPCYNDAATIASMVLSVAETLEALTDDYEVIVVNDCSEDDSGSVLAKLQQRCPYLRVVTHESNRGYGGALRSGFRAATKELVFYTDGDAQYDPHELGALHAALRPGVDVVQGRKIERQDALHRRIVGRLYHHAVRLLFNLHVHDVDCDFRLIRRRVLDSFSLTSDSGSITVELVARIEEGGFHIQEIPVHHYARPYGRSQFFSLRRIAYTLWQLSGLWINMHLGSGLVEAPVAPGIAVQPD